ncbi:benzoate membrane transport protein [Chitinasiproducens palmae]|uniref:Benzoate membrane transport protein n=1 Tax=Chitinasiproducens palmae TaxID=1770053 RepID=A0A1H2PJ69_9BURK|nr:benzoate membrane transport protein [Chitinasiproducens palmae]
MYLALAFVCVTFSATGPIGILMTAARQAGLSKQQTSSLMFAALLISGLASVVVSYMTRQPLLFLSTIAGALLMPPVVLHYGLGAAVGTCLVCGAALVALGVTGIVTVPDRWVPMPVAMAMIAALFLRYVVAVVHASVTAPWLGAAMLAVFVGLSWPERHRTTPLPPIAGALVACAAVLLLSGFCVGADAANH